MTAEEFLHLRDPGGKQHPSSAFDFSLLQMNGRVPAADRSVGYRDEEVHVDKLKGGYRLVDHDGRVVAVIHKGVAYYDRPHWKRRIPKDVQVQGRNERVDLGSSPSGRSSTSRRSRRSSVRSPRRTASIPRRLAAHHRRWRAHDDPCGEDAEEGRGCQFGGLQWGGARCGASPERGWARLWARSRRSTAARGSGSSSASTGTSSIRSSRPAGSPPQASGTRFVSGRGVSRNSWPAAGTRRSCVRAG